MLDRWTTSGNEDILHLRHFCHPSKHTLSPASTITRENVKTACRKQCCSEFRLLAKKLFGRRQRSSSLAENREPLTSAQQKQNWLVTDQLRASEVFLRCLGGFIHSSRSVCNIIFVSVANVLNVLCLLLTFRMFTNGNTLCWTNSRQALKWRSSPALFVSTETSGAVQAVEILAVTERLMRVMSSR